MSYLDQGMSPSRLWAIVIVAIVHALLGFALVTGFAQKFVREAAKDLDVFDVQEPPPPEEEPPPPPEQPPQAQEIQTPPAVVQVNTPPPPAPVSTPPAPSAPFNPAPAGPAPTPPAPPPPPPPPPPPAAPPTPARQIGGSISDADYPASAIRAEAQGTTTVSIQIGANGRVTGCTVSGSSGNSALDSTACSLVQRRFRFQPATQNGQPVASTTTRRITWRLPRD